MDQTKDSHPHGNHPVTPLSLLSPFFIPGDDQATLPPGASILVSALQWCPAMSGMSKTENLLSLASVRPRDLGLPLVHPPSGGVRDFPQTDTHLGPFGEHAAVL